MSTLTVEQADAVTAVVTSGRTLDVLVGAERPLVEPAQLVPQHGQGPDLGRLAIGQRHARGEAIGRMKAAGVSYEQRMQEADEITWPQPLAEELKAALEIYRQQETQAIVKAYLGLAAALFVVAAAVWAYYDR